MMGVLKILQPNKRFALYFCNMRYLLIIIALFTLVSCYETERNCKKFKTGTFEFKTLVGDSIESTLFYRNDSIEIEKYKGITDTSSIRWINDCEYILKSISPESIDEKKQIHFKILSTKNDSYRFEYKMVNSNKKQTGKAVKISNENQIKR